MVTADHDTTGGLPTLQKSAMGYTEADDDEAAREGGGEMTPIERAQAMLSEKNVETLYPGEQYDDGPDMAKAMIDDLQRYIAWRNGLGLGETP